MKKKSLALLSFKNKLIWLLLIKEDFVKDDKDYITSGSIQSCPNWDTAVYKLWLI